MKKDIHPEYQDTRVVCSCGETFTTRSTQKELKVEICSKCHPFYTGKQKFVDTGGRVERFQRKYGEVKRVVKAAKAPEPEAAPAQEEAPEPPAAPEPEAAPESEPEEAKADATEEPKTDEEEQAESKDS